MLPIVRRIIYVLKIFKLLRTLVREASFVILGGLFVMILFQLSVVFLGFPLIMCCI